MIVQDNLYRDMNACEGGNVLRQKYKRQKLMCNMTACRLCTCLFVICNHHHDTSVSFYCIYTYIDHGGYRAFACDVTCTGRGVQPGPGLPPYEAVFKNKAHRCRVGRKGRQMVPQTVFKSTFDQRKRNKKT